ncbi:MAG: hypothetical protein SOZ40_01025 [Ezakiella sp.]|nr:hypothetical protein [Bacillota bacterium]MDY3946567.1 hypothetical protein [Ezakiella sp.]
MKDFWQEVKALFKDEMLRRALIVGTLLLIGSILMLILIKKEGFI